MICVQCRNEKWDQDTCPHCGLDEKLALLTKADQLRLAGNNALAAEYFTKFLGYDPDNSEVLKRNAGCLYFEAISTKSETWFEKADAGLKASLARDWDWSQGHQLRVDLSFYYHRLDELAREYESISLQNGPQQKIALEVLKIIRLTKKFKEAPPDVQVQISSDNEWFLLVKSFWPSALAIPFLLWLIYRITSASNAREDSNVAALFLVLMVIVMAVILVVYLCMVFYKRNKKKEAKEKKIA